jgi:hypothetical protein
MQLHHKNSCPAATALWAETGEAVQLSLWRLYGWIRDSPRSRIKTDLEPRIGMRQKYMQARKTVEKWGGQRHRVKAEFKAWTDFEHGCLSREYRARIWADKGWLESAGRHQFKLADRRACHNAG